MKLFKSLLASQGKHNILLQIHGQSNARASTNGSTPSISGDITGGFIYNSGSFEQLNYPGNNDVDTSAVNIFGIELRFTKLFNDLTGRNLYIAKKAVGSTGIGVDGTADDWNVSTNELINDVIASTNVLLTQSLTMENPKHVFYTHWGERDANLLNANFYNDFVAILGVVNAIYPIDLCIVPVLHDDAWVDSPITQAGVQLIQPLQRQLATDISYIENIEMSQFALGADGIHFTGATQEALADICFAFCQTEFNL
jgi:hypothetical protein